MVNVQDCDIDVSEFQLLSRYNIHFVSNTLGLLVGFGFMAYQLL